MFINQPPGHHFLYDKPGKIALELNLFGHYKIEDTIYFESNLGNIDTIVIVDVLEEKHKGSSCFIQTKPYHSKSVLIKHLPNDKWYGTTWSEEDGKRIAYQSLITIFKSPLDSAKNRTEFSINFKGFTTLGNALGISQGEFTVNGKIIYECSKVIHGYSERVINPDDIEFLYWTAIHGLIAYSSKSGETWFIKYLE